MSLFCRHKDVEVSRQIGEGPASYLLPTPVARTIITFRCEKCGRHRQVALNGHVRANHG